MAELTFMFRQQTIVDEPQDDLQMTLQQGHDLDAMFQLNLTCNGRKSNEWLILQIGCHRYELGTTMDG